MGYRRGHMATTQQNEALAFFKKFAGEWERKGAGLAVDTVNNIKQRNDFVLKVIGEREKTAALLSERVVMRAVRVAHGPARGIGAY